MTTEDFTEAARAEAEYQHPAFESPSTGRKLWPASRDSFITGAEWARTHLAAREPTDAEVEAAEHEHERHSHALRRGELGGGYCTACGHEFDAYHEGQPAHAIRAALSAARRDEEPR